MEEAVDECERRMSLRADRADIDERMTVREWIDAKTAHAFDLVRNYLLNYSDPEERQRYPAKQFGRTVVDEFGDEMAVATRALIRFTFHVGKLYRCKLDKIVVLCDRELDYDWLRLLNKVVEKTADWCDALLECPRYDFLLLPTLAVQRRTIESEGIVATVKRSFAGYENKAPA